MTSCGYWSCEYCTGPAVARCETCDAACCPECMVEGDDSGLDYCSPDPATWPGRGCYKQPVKEVS